MLKHNGILPLNTKYSTPKTKPAVLVCGPLANAPHEQNGTWCFDKDDAMTITPMMAFREHDIQTVLPSNRTAGQQFHYI